MNGLLKNQKGQQIIEVLISLFLVGFFVSGLIGFYQYTGDFQEVKDWTLVERNFTFIQNVLAQNCDSFVGDKLTNSSYVNSNPLREQDASAPQITMKNPAPPYEHKLLYTTSDIKGHSLSSHPNIAIKGITLQKATAEYSYLTIAFESLKTFKEYEKTIKLYMAVDSHNTVIDCSLKPVLPCAEQNIAISYVWEEREGKTSKWYRCRASKEEEASGPELGDLPAGWLKGGPALPGETVSVTDTSSSCCVCMVQLLCSEGFWSQSSDCFKRKGGCVAPTPETCSHGRVFDPVRNSCKCPAGKFWHHSIGCFECDGGRIGKGPDCV